MKRLKHCGLVICLGLLFLAGSGCGRATDYVQENPRTVLGSAAGAATGALIGGLAFDSAAATVAGTLLGGLAGGVIGNVLEKKNENYDATARDYKFTPGKKAIVRVEEVDADPTRVNARRPIHLMARYALLPDDRNEKVRVTERWVITHNGQVVGNPVINVTRTGGTWTTAIPLQLPPNADPGTYRAQVEVQAAGAVDQGSTTFRIG